MWTQLSALHGKKKHWWVPLDFLSLRHLKQTAIICCNSWFWLCTTCVFSILSKCQCLIYWFSWLCVETIEWSLFCTFGVSYFVRIETLKKCQARASLADMAVWKFEIFDVHFKGLVGVCVWGGGGHVLKFSQMLILLMLQLNMSSVWIQKIIMIIHISRIIVVFWT